MKKLLVLLLLTGCDTVDLALVDVDAGDTFTPMMGRPCANSEACAGGQLCEKRQCGDALGRCVQQPAFCDADSRPECGCDGITYWNDCLRRKAKVEGRTPGPCFSGVMCDLNAPCPGNAICARLIQPNDCGRTVAGACFVLPETCQGPHPIHFKPCTDLTQCLDPCAAIRSGEPMAQYDGQCP